MKLEHQMKMHELYAQWHMTRATTGDYKRDQVSKGRDILTEKQLLECCLSVAKTHIKLYAECADELQLQEEKYP